MSDKQLETVSKKLDTITKLLAFNLIKDKSVNDQIDILSKAGIKVGDIAQIVGRSENQVYVTQTNLRKKKKQSQTTIESKEKQDV